MNYTAIVVNYHGAEDTLAAVGSVLADEPACAIIVVDNSCSATEARRLEAGLPSSAQLIVAPANLGFAAACNLAFTRCESEFLLLINPDARLLPGALGLLRAAFAADRRLAAVAPATWWDEKKHWLLPTLLPETAARWLLDALASRWPTSLREAVARRWLAWQQRLHAGQSPQPVAYLSGAVLALRRQAVEAAGGLFDERFFMFYEDADLSRRLRAAGFRLALEPRAQAVHHWRNRAAKAALMTPSAARYLAKHYPVAQRFLPGLLAALRSSQGDGPGIARGFCPSFASAEAWMHWLGAGKIICLSPSALGYPATFRPLGATPLAGDPACWAAIEPGRHWLLAQRGGRSVWLAFEKVPA